MKRNYWQVGLFMGKGSKPLTAIFDDKPTADRFALDAVEIGPFRAATVEAFELNEEFGPKAQWLTFDEFLVDWKERSA